MTGSPLFVISEVYVVNAATDPTPSIAAIKIGVVDLIQTHEDKIKIAIMHKYRIIKILAMSKSPVLYLMFWTSKQWMKLLS